MYNYLVGSKSAFEKSFLDSMTFPRKPDFRSNFLWLTHIDTRNPIINRLRIFFGWMYENTKGGFREDSKHRERRASLFHEALQAVRLQLPHNEEKP